MSWFEKGIGEAAKAIGIALISMGIPALITWYVTDDDKELEEPDPVQVYEDTVFRVMEFKDAGLYGQTRFLQQEGVDPINYTRVIECILNHSGLTVITSDMVKACEEKNGL